jgi:Flp pilus assembly protein TadG
VISKNEAGQTLLETALVLPVLLMILLGAAELARVTYISIEVANAAEAGTAYGSQNGGTAADTSGIQTAAQTDAYDVFTSTGVQVVATSSLSCECEPASSADNPISVLCTDNTTCTSKNLSMETTLVVSTSASVTPLIHIPGLPATYILPGQSVQKVLN